MAQPKNSQARIPILQWGQHKPDIGRFWLLIVRPYALPVGLIFMAQTIAALSQVMMPYALSSMVQEVAVDHQGGALDWNMLLVYLIGFCLFALSDFYFTRLGCNTQLFVGSNIRHTAVVCLFNHLMYHSQRYVINHQTGFLTSKMMEAATALTEGLWIFITELWPTIVIVGLSVFALSRIHPVLGLAVLLWAILFIGCALYFSKKRYPLAKLTASAHAKSAGTLNDVVSNLFTVKLFAQGQQELTQLRAVLDAENRETIAYAAELEKSRVTLYFIANMFKIVSLLLAGWLVTSDGLSASHFVLLVFLTNVVISQAQTGSNRLGEFLGVNARVDSAVSSILQAHEITDDHATKAHFPLSGNIVFKEVCLSYDQSNEVVKNLSVEIPARQKVGIVGTSGAGKTSFANLLLRLVDVSSGAIFIDGVELRHIPLASLYQQIAVIPQEPALFHRTIMENIRYGKQNATDAEVIDAARRALCHDFIMALPDQYQALIGERGVKLSGGQRQRIAIARAMLKDAPIIVLDEATSALDTLTEAGIQASLHDVMQGKTVVVIAHRLSTIMQLDRILVFESGKIVEDGTHATLITQNGRYAEMWRHQSDGTGAQNL